MPRQVLLQCAPRHIPYFQRCVFGAGDEVAGVGGEVADVDRSDVGAEGVEEGAVLEGPVTG